VIMRRTRWTVALVAALASAATGVAIAQAPATIDRAHVPSGHGWFCFEDPLPRGGTTWTCDRPRRACEQLRGLRHASGESTGGCVPSPSAFCVTYVDHTEAPAGTHHACVRERAQCVALHAELEGSNHDQQTYSRLSECTEVR
jgi:hypothetical protein